MTRLHGRYVRATTVYARSVLATVVPIAIVVTMTFPSVPSSVQTPSYLLYVASESADEVSLLRFVPDLGIEVEKVIPVGFWPVEMEAPHGVSVSPDGAYWYLTLGHGFPFGTLLKYRTGVDTLVERIELGLFPATVGITPGGDLAFVVNSNFHGEHLPSTVSVVETDLMIEIDRLETCTMPHGSRLTADGSRHYSACMIDDELVEIDAIAIEVARRLDVSPADGSRCSPTWAAPSADGKYVYVMCNKSSEIVEVDVARWEVSRRWGAPKAPYNAQVTPDGRRLLVTQKGSAQVSVWDIESGRRLALLASSRTITHGVAVASDGLYAFVSIEGVGGEPGTVDVIDLTTLETVASVDVGKQAGGIAFWRMEGNGAT